MRQLPTYVQPPVVSKSNPDDQPILTLGLSGAFAPQLLADVARYQIQDALETLPGVGQVTTSGYLDRNVRIWIDAEKLVATGVTVTDITQALAKQHVTSAGGPMDDGGRALDVRILGEAPDLETIRNVVVRTINGSPVRLGDVAFVQDGFADRTSLARYNGMPVQAIGILEQPGSNAVAVARSVRAAMADVEKTLPAGMKIEVLFDTTQFIEESVAEIGLELGLAVVLTGLVCWLFLGSLSSTMNVLFAIPMSLFGTIAVLYSAGFTLNTFTLLGLSLAVGLVVDDAVMVMENIFRHAEMGKDRLKAAADGTHEITFAALAATIAVIAIFLPVAFMSGIIGKFFLQFGVTLSVAVAVSYLEAITLAPSRCAQMLQTGHQERTGLGRAVDRAFDELSRAYSGGLARSLRWPWLTLAVGAAVLASSAWTATFIKQEFVPSQDQARPWLRVTGTIGSDIGETDRLVGLVEKDLEKHPEIIGILTNVNAGSASLSLRMVPASERKITQADIQATLRKELNGIAGANITVQDLSTQMFGGGSGGGSAIELSVRGSDWPTLVALAGSLRDQIGKSGFAVDVNTDYAPELVIAPDRPRASDLGLAVQDIATSVSALLGGTTVGQYSSGGRRMDIRMRLLASQRSRPEDLERLYLRTAAGSLVPLASVATSHEQPELQSINLADRERAIRIYANVPPGKLQGEALAYVQGLVKDVPPGYRLVLGGQSSQFGDAMTSLFFALMVGILVAYMVLASQFNSFLHPVTVLTILPLSVAGAIFALLIASKTLNVFSMIGPLALDGHREEELHHPRRLRERGAREREARRDRRDEARGPGALRPILMTAVATLMAAVPSALGLGPGAETRAPMADAVIGGLVLSTALSLFVVPAFYVLSDRMKARFSRGHATRGARAQEPHGTAAGS